MNKYLGEVLVNIEDSPFKGYTETDFAMYFIERYGQIDGVHHKAWVLDQVARILNGTPVIIKKASWADSLVEYRLTTGEPSKKYLDWVVKMMSGALDDGEEYTYSYDKGIAP